MSAPTVRRIQCPDCENGFVDVPGKMLKRRCDSCSGHGSSPAVECPAHAGQLVPVDVDERVLGSCPACRREACRGIRAIEENAMVGAAA